MTEFLEQGIAELRAALQRGDVSAVEVLDALHERIVQEDGELGAYLSLDLPDARARAAQADLTLPLGGVPIAIKDNINVAGQLCTCASKMLRNYRAPYDATVVEKLVAAGAIPFGKTNLDEFGMGSSTENSALQVTRNPWDRTRVPGGSSGGAAAAVAARLAFGALGTDTGGSVRQPAAFCGVVGLKPTYGRVSRAGVVAFASSLDQVGPLTRNVRDAALLLNAIAGADGKDSTCLEEPVPDYTAGLGAEIRGLRLGVVAEFMSKGIAPAVAQAVRAAVDHFASLGAEIVEVSLPHTEYAVATYHLLATAEASANLARFDGVRYGERAAAPTNLLDHYERTRAEGFGAEVKRRILLGTYALSSGYHEAYYVRAQKVRELMRRDLAGALAKADALVSPTSPVPAFALGARSGDPLQMYLADIFTITANLTGTCALSLPCGFAEENGARLPVGLQLMGSAFAEARLLQIAFAYEQSTPWHKEKPPARLRE